ncbi:MAG: hypothetical protein Q9186_005455 [Xanthomendoza sp. 1 TL-2023]
MASLWMDLHNHAVRYEGQASSPPRAMVVYALIIINKAGGLVYNRDFSSPLSKLSSNDYLVLAGTFHGVHAITRSLTPAPITSAISRSQLTGLEVLESSNFRLTCFQTPTGIKFLLFTEPHQPNCDAIVGKVYELYADYVTKNPFYALEMPVRFPWNGCSGIIRDETPGQGSQGVATMVTSYELAVAQEDKQHKNIEEGYDRRSKLQKSQSYVCSLGQLS